MNERVDLTSASSTYACLDGCIIVGNRTASVDQTAQHLLNKSDGIIWDDYTPQVTAAGCLKGVGGLEGRCGLVGVRTEEFPFSLEILKVTRKEAARR